MNSVFNDPRLLRKGVFPYEYVTSLDKLETTPTLPPKESFYSTLTDTHVSDEEYAFAGEMFREYACASLKDYCKLYLETDVCLLADIFQDFRTLCLNHYELDPVHYISLPALSWDALLKMTGVELELLTDPDKHLFFEKAIRGGYAGMVQRLGVASDSQAISYLDANNLYGHAMVQPQPIGDFEWVNPTTFNIDQSLCTQSGVGHVLEVDLEYPAHLHDLHSDFPLAPEQRWIHYNDLSPHSRTFGKSSHRSKKLCQTLHDKKSYVVHGRLLKLYMELGLKVTLVRRVMRFREEAWMEPYITKNTQFRQQA